MILTQQDKTIKMKRKVLLIIINYLTMVSCNGQSENDSKNNLIKPQNETMDSKTEITLKKQLEEGAYQFAPDGSDVGKPAFSNEEIRTLVNVEDNIESDEIEKDNPYVLTLKDLELSFEVINEGLKIHGYKKPSVEKFKSFVMVNTDANFQYAKYFDANCLAWKNDNFFPQFALVDRGHYIFSSSKYFFITDFFLLKEIINIRSDDKYTITIPQNIIARNKYLFNDSKADFVWLKANDKIFLESLVKIFGYVKDKDLLEFVVKNNFRDKVELNAILWNQKCDGTAQVNKEVFDLVKTWSPQDLSVFSHNVLEVMLNLMKEIREDKSTNFAQKTKALGLIAYYATKTNQDFYYRFFPLLNDPDFDTEFKKANYYNIPDFKEIYEDARYGGIGQAE